MKKGIISKLLTALLVVGLLFSILPSQQAQAQAVTPIKVTPSNMNGWSFTKDSANNPGTGNYALEFGPATPPLGFGSLKIVTPHQNDKAALVKSGFSGIKLSEIEHLVYSTYKVAGGNTSMNITVQFPISIGGRLVYEPYWNGSVKNNEWQTWNALEGRWWRTSGGDVECGMNQPCTIDRVIEKWPSVYINGSFYVEAGTYATGLVAYADDLQISYDGNDFIFDFDPDPIIIYVDDDFAEGTTPGFGVTHFDKIQDGINAVMPGSTVNVAAGIYNEDLTINKSFTLLGAGRESTIVNGVVAANQNGMVNIIASDVSISGFTFNGVSSKTIQFTEDTSNVSFTNNKVVGAENASDANNFTLLENNYNTVQTGHVISGNIFVADNTSQLVYFNPTNSEITFTNNSFSGSSKTGGVGLVFEEPWGEKTVTGNDFSAITGTPFALLSAPGSTPEDMGGLLAGNTFPANYMAFGTDIRKAKAVLNQTQGLDYDTIQAAINAANTDDVITVAAGTYVENLTVSKKITLTGAGMDLTTVVGTNGNATNLTFATDGATVQGFHFTHEYTQAELDAWDFNSTGVTFVQGRSGNTLKNSKVTLARNGIYLNNTQGNIFEGNLVENNRTGFNMTNVVNGTKLLNNTIKDNWTLGFVYYSLGQMTDFDTVTISGNHFVDNWYSEILIKDAQVSTGTLNVTGNTFSDNPVTMTNNADPKWNEPGFAAQKPLSLGGTAVAPTTPWPTLRIYNSTGVTLVHDQQVLVEFTSLQEAINLANSGATIMVAPGTYNEDLTIDKAITLQGPGFVETFDDPIDLTKWYVDRKDAGVFESGIFQGENVLHHGIRAVDHDPANNFYNHQGRKIDINLTGPNQIVSIDLFVGEDWNTEQRGAGMWATGFDAANDVSAYPIVAFRHSATEAPGFYAFDYINGGWTLLRAAKASDFGRWHTIEFELIAGEGVKHYINGEMLLSFADADTISFGNVILNASNFAEDYDIYWDNFGAHDARINGEVHVSAGNVNLNGLMLSNPGDTQAVVIHSTANGVNLSENLILEVGGKAYNEKVQAVYLQSGPDQVKIENNLFTRIHASNKSVNGIYSGDTLSTNTAEGLIIKDNRFVNITSATKGAYGILLNNGAGNPAAVIQGNLFSNVAGGWTHAIGMEGPTPGATIEKNIFNELAYGDAHAAIFFEANPDYGTTQIISNQFLSTDYFSVAVHPSMGNVAPIIVARNWWGKTSGPEFPLQLDDPINFGFSPWCLDAACTLFSAEPEVGFELSEIAGACDATQKTIEIKATNLANLTAFTMAFEYNQNLVEIVKVENATGMPGVVAADVDNTVDGKYLFDFYRQGGSPISGAASLIKITYKSKQLAGEAVFTLDAANSMLVQWPDVNPMPVTVSNASTKVTYPLVATNMNKSLGYCDLGVAIAQADSSNTIQVEVDITTADAYTIDKTLTLNVQTYNISTSSLAAFTVNTGGDLTLTGSGTIESTHASGRVLVVNGTDETLAAKATLNGPELKAPYFSIVVLGNQTGDYSEAKASHKAEVTITSGKTWETVSVQGKGAKLTIDGGTLTGYAPLMGNGNSYNWGTEITMNGGVIDSTLYTHTNPNANRIAIYHPQVGSLTITGGEIKGSEGIEMKAGELSITGGTIIANGPYQEPMASTNSSSYGGNAILLYSRSGYGGGNPITATITGGTFSSANGYALREYYIEGTDTSRLDKVTISGGTFTGGTGKEAVIFTTADPVHDKLALTDGAYSTDPVEYVYSPLATYLHTDNYYHITTQPTITADPFAAYYLTVDENAFKATLTNPAGAASYAHAMVKLTIPGATLADLAKIQFIEPAGLANITWKEVGTDLVGWYGGVAIGGVPLPAGASVDRDIKIKFNEAGIYTLKGELYQMDGDIVTDGDYSGHAISKLTEASFSVTVYNKPVITTDLVGPYHAGEAANVIINVNNVDAVFTPDKTELHLDLPEGTIVVYDSVEYVCTATGCVIPVTLAEPDNALAVKITFPGAFEDEITIGLFDKSVIPGKQLAEFETPAVVSVYGNVATFTGTVSMQGQLTNRKNVPMTLTGLPGFAFGPYNATSDSRGKLTFTDLAVGSYFVTTNQARYLNLYIGSVPAEQWIADLSTLTSLPDLWLRGGNAVWTDNIINDQDSGLVASGYISGPSGALADADVNFDGRVNIQDLALVGGNYLLTSATAYGSWLPTP